MTEWVFAVEWLVKREQKAQCVSNTYAALQALRNDNKYTFGDEQV